jgi:hypothetical protein
MYLQGFKTNFFYRIVSWSCLCLFFLFIWVFLTFLRFREIKILDFTDVTDKKDNVNVHKAIYQCAWGDIGSMVVTRTCKNLNCGNPLHMVSSWNRLYPPSAVNPFCIEFDAQKLMQYANLSKRIDARLLIEQHYKQTITHPLDAPEPPYYDEG